jgi:hypothetical protein
MQKLKKLIEVVGQKLPIEESLPRVGGVYLKKGMKVRLKTKDEMLKNHYYENHPQTYKKLISQVAGTEQTIETVYGSNRSFSANNIKLDGFELLIEPDDIQYIIDFAGTLVIPKPHMDTLKNEIDKLIRKYLSTKTTINVDDISLKEMGKIVRDIASMIAKEK